jgi:hypothetical protein
MSGAAWLRILSYSDSSLDSAWQVPGVKFSPVLSSSVLVLLVLTLGWKLAVRPDSSNELEKKEIDRQRKIADFLVRQHFTTVVPEKTTSELLMIRATAGACRILVIKTSFDGSDGERISRYASARDTVFVVFGGRIYAEQPTFLSVSDELWARFQRQLGLKAEATPVLVVIATKGCEAGQLPWHQLSDQKRASAGAAGGLPFSATGLWPRTGGASMLESKK